MKKKSSRNATRFPIAGSEFKIVFTSSCSDCSGGGGGGGAVVVSL